MTDGTVTILRSRNSGDAYVLLSQGSERQVVQLNHQPGEEPRVMTLGNINVDVNPPDCTHLRDRAKTYKRRFGGV
ncbi:MAG: hypothetical protein WBD86_00070 [Microgenomates group bacterium]